MSDEDKELNIDEIMEMMEEVPEIESTSEHQLSPPDEVQVEAADEEVAAPRQEVDEEARRAMYQLQRENQEIKARLEALAEEKDRAEIVAVQGALNNFQTNIDAAGNENERLKQVLIRAREDGDTAASVEAESRIRDNIERIRDYKSKIDQYAPLLNAPREQRAERQAPESDRGDNLAAQWVKDNEAWLTDPQQEDKRNFANTAFKEMQEKNYDLNSLSFWTALEKKVAGFEASKKQSQTRMPKQMVAYNPNGSGNAPVAKRSTYKSDPNFVKNAAHIAKNIIKNDDITSDPVKLNAFMKHYYPVWKAGNFKHIPMNGL